MSGARTLYVAISSHGYGHIAQTAPLLNELHRRTTDVRIVVECAAPREILARRLDMPFEHVPVATDFGMVMRNALEVDVAASHARYAEAHKRIDADVGAARQRMLEHGADVLLSNVAYVPLLAATSIAIPALSMCSLNWADIYGQLCGSLHGAKQIHGTMLDAYRAADVFMRLDPGMDMAELRNAVVVPPIASLGSSIRTELFKKLDLPADARLVVVSMGGIATDLSLSRWPRIRGVTWLMPDGSDIGRSDMVPVSVLGERFIDIMCSSDALITKPGYGAFVEAACNGVPVLYVPRIDWPEAPFLVRWLHERGKCREISYDDLFGDHLRGALDALWQVRRAEPVAPTGATEAANVLQGFFAPAIRDNVQAAK
jgi:UDP:flavonoid glycosyltransferase YjiC (YdhE family)